MDENSDEEGEDEFVSDDEEQAPEAIPIGSKEISHEKKDKQVSDIDVDDYGNSEESDSDDELDMDPAANPHGFVYGSMLETYSKTRRDRIEEMREAKDMEAWRSKFKKKRSTKKIGKSEKVHQKNKPFMMLKQKKITMAREKIRPLN